MTQARPSSEIAERLLDGDRLALSRLISWAENGDARFPAALSAIYGRVGRAWRVGVTGPPGAGKSSLVNQLVANLREDDATVGILAIDPSSPFSGGALLGDRIRMDRRTADPGVYIRSMASRGGHGGLARATADACDVMDAFGFDWVVVETVGVGQSEYDVVAATDTVAVVLCPGAGDGIQAMKAGILEIADVLVVNKADLDGADQLVLDLEDALRLRDLGGHSEGWEVPVVPARGLDPDGAEALMAAIRAHRAHAEGRDLAGRRAAKRVQQVRRVVGEKLDEALFGHDRWGSRVETALRKSGTPYDVAEMILSDVLGGAGRSGASPGGHGQEGSGSPRETGSPS